MFRYQILIEYVGTNFRGWQIQKKGKTIQGLLQEKISKLLKEKIILLGSGRTDTGVHAIEQSLFSYELGVAGSVDCIAEYEDELAIIDFKTSKKPKPRKWIDSHFVQCAAYACMLYEMTGIMVKKFVIIM